MKFDAMLLALCLPRAGAMVWDLFYRPLRRIRSDIRVIMSSGYNEQEVSHRFAGKGMAGFIQKPYALKNLREELRRVLG